MTKTKTHSTMIYRGPTMSICKMFVCFVRSINDFQFILKGLYTIRSLDICGQIIPFTYCFRKKRFRENFFMYEGQKKRVISTQIVCISVMGNKIADLP